MHTSIIYIIFFIAAFLLLIIVFFGRQPLVWRYYYRSIFNLPIDNKARYPFTKLFPGFRTGWFKNNYRSDPNLISGFNKSNVSNMAGINISLRLTNEKMTDKPNDCTYARSYHFSGAMIESENDLTVNQKIADQLREFSTEVQVTVPFKKYVKTHIALRDINKPNKVHEITLLECLNISMLNIFGRKYVKLTFVAHEGDDYLDSYRYYPTSIWFRAGKQVRIAFKVVNGTMKWFVNERLVKEHPNTLPENCVMRSQASISLVKPTTKMLDEQLKLVVS